MGELMSQAKHPHTDPQNSSQSALEAAEHRAQRAEEKLEQLQRTVAELQSQTRSEISQPSPDPPSKSAEASSRELRAEPMMAHLMDSLEAGKDIGHYGRMVFAMIAHQFLPPEQVLDWLNKDPDFGHDQAIALLRQVESRDYNPPRRDRILAWQAQQDFPIIPNPDDPDCGNVYRNLKFPEKVYEHIQEYQEEKTEAESY
jgi:hypothetical protein